MAATLNFDGKTYEIDSLSEEAKQLVGSLRVAEAKLNQLQQETALIQTARSTYIQALAAQLPKAAD